MVSSLQKALELAGYAMPETCEDAIAVFSSLPSKKQADISRRKGYIETFSPDYNSSLVRRAAERMSRVDGFTPAIRAVIHECGLEVVQEFWNHGVRDAKKMRYLIETARGDKFANGQNRFRLNQSPNRAHNPAGRDDLDDSMVELAADIYLARIDRGDTHEDAIKAALLAAFNRH